MIRVKLNSSITSDVYGWASITQGAYRESYPIKLSSEEYTIIETQISGADGGAYSQSGVFFSTSNTKAIPQEIKYTITSKDDSISNVRFENHALMWDDSTDGSSGNIDIEITSIVAAVEVDLSSYITSSKSSIVVVTKDSNGVSASSDPIITTTSFCVANKLQNSIIYNPNSTGTYTYQYTFVNNILPKSVAINGIWSKTGQDNSYTVTEDSVTYHMQPGHHSISLNTAGLLTLTCSDSNSDGISPIEPETIYIQFSNGVVQDADVFKVQFNISEVCLAKGMFVATPTGLKAIETFADGDEIYTYVEDTGEVLVDTVSSFQIINGATTVTNITLEDGSVIRCTRTHGLLTKDGWKVAMPHDYLIIQEQLKVGDYLIRQDNTEAMITDISYDKHPQPVYHLALMNGNTFYTTDSVDHPAVISEHYFQDLSDDAENTAGGGQLRVGYGL